jgi:hypothetical protein
MCEVTVGSDECGVVFFLSLLKSGADVREWLVVVRQTAARLG